MTGERPEIDLNAEAVYGLKCRHGCDEAIVGVFHFPDGCVCLDDRVQALCTHHFLRASSNIVHGEIIRLLSFGDWPDMDAIGRPAP